MKIVEQKHQFVKEKDPLKLIEACGRICYKTEDKITDDSAKRFVQMLVKAGHYSVLEHVNACFEIESKATEYLTNSKHTKYLYWSLENNRILVSGNFRAWLEFFQREYFTHLSNQLQLIHDYLNFNFPEVFPTPVSFDIPGVVNRIHEDQMTTKEKLIHATRSCRFITNRGCCYDDQTEVLTEQGWKFFHDLTGQEKIACLNDANILSYEKPSNYIVKEWEGELLHFQSTSIDLLVTPNHNMWVFDYDKRASATRTWKFIKAEDLTNGRYTFYKTAIWQGKTQEITIPAHPTKQKAFPAIKYTPEKTADLFELLGLWITDGSYRYGKDAGSCIQISQTKTKVRKRINYLCENLGLKTYWYKNEIRIDNLRLLNFTESLFGSGAKTFDALIPSIIKKARVSQIKRFLAGVIAGDGNIHKTNKHQVVYTASKRFADDLQELFLKVGLSANIRTIAPRIRGEILGQPVGKTKTTYVVSVHGKKRSAPLLDKRTAKEFRKETYYKGKVFCITVPHHRLYVRRNGKAVWCGNSHEMVRHRNFSFSQESTRYVKYDGDMEFILPVWIDKRFLGTWKNSPGPKGTHSLEDLWFDCMEGAEYDYQFLLKEGWRPEQARGVLPNDLKTEIVCTAPLAEWKHMLNLRTSKAAHPQIRHLLIPVLEELQKELPEIFLS